MVFLNPVHPDPVHPDPVHPGLCGVMATHLEGGVGDAFVEVQAG